MPPSTAAFLISHVLTGLIGIAASAGTLIFLSKGKQGASRAVRSACLAFVAYVSAWILGGFYYVTSYAKSVKPVIKAGEFILAHTFVMEVKEHLFLFVPFLALTVLCATAAIRKGADGLVSSTKMLSLLTTILGLLMLFGGLAISGAFELSR